MRLLVIALLAVIGVCLPVPPGLNLYTLRPNSVALNASVTAALPTVYQCPNGTEYILLARGNAVTADPTTYAVPQLLSSFRFLGCVQPNSVGCLVDRNSQLSGACPNGTFCCYDDQKRLTGCVDDVNRCCNNVVCPAGWGCCSNAPLFIPRVGDNTNTRVIDVNYVGTFSCCPLPPGAIISDRSTYCEVNATTGTEQSCLVSYSQGLDYCPYYQYANFINFTVPGSYPSPFVSTVPTPCYGNLPNQNAARLCSNYTIKCPDTASQCSYIATVDRVPITNLTTNATQYVVLNQSAVAGCCPANTQMCYGDPITHLSSNRYGGCADPTKGETCCGPLICSNGTMCCKKTYNVTSVDPITDDLIVLTFEIAVGCIPPELQCCFNNIRTSGRKTAFRQQFYAGQALNGVNCSISRWREPFWYYIQRTQQNGFQPPLLAAP